MKKIISVLLALLSVFILAVPCFAATPAKFSITLVSEDNTSAVVSVDYAGGSTFGAFDFDLKYNAKKLKANSAYSGDGMDAFAKYVQKNNGAILPPQINFAVNPIKVSCASTIPFKAVNGKDLCVFSFKKLTKEKINADDLNLVFTSCTSENGSTVKTEVSSSLTPSGTTVPAKTTEAKTTAKTTSVASASDKTTSSSVSDKTSGNVKTTEAASASSVSEIATDNSQITQAENQQENTAKGNTKKIVIVAALAVCMLFVIVAVCIYVVKKTKKADGAE